MNKIKLIFKYILLFIIGGSIYYNIEIISRGYSHISMFILAGIVFICMGLINEIISWNTSLLLQGLYGTIISTIGEFITGYIVNICLGLNVWDYTNLPFNILGQICLQYSFIWFGLSLLGIILDDYIRYFIFHEEKPRYKWF